MDGQERKTFLQSFLRSIKVVPSEIIESYTAFKIKHYEILQFLEDANILFIIMLLTLIHAKRPQDQALPHIKMFN